MTIIQEDASIMETFADAEAVLAEALPGYESREPQQLLAQGVERLFAKPEHFTFYDVPEEDYPEWVRPGLTHFLGQAGTGVGKSLGYLIPAILSGRRVVVSVTTKALQGQLANVDIPFLETHLGIDFSWTLLKGRSNYLCVNRMAALTITDAPELPDIVRLMQDDPEFTGEREDIERALGREIRGSSWSLMCSDSDECANCKPSNDYAARARAIARESRLVVVNHALLCTDLVVKSWGRPGMLGEVDAVVIDEAHSFGEVATNTLGGQITQGSFNSLGTQIRNWASQHADDRGRSLTTPLADLARSSEALFAVLEKGRLVDAKILEAADQFFDVNVAIRSLSGALMRSEFEKAKEYTKAKQRKQSLRIQVGSLIRRLDEVMTSAQTSTVRWVEVERTRGGEERKVIKVAPILVAPFLHQWLFTKTPCVLVSATLAVKGSFSYIAGQLGIPEFDGLDVGTPFDFPSQGRLYVPAHLPEPRGAEQSEWQAMANHEISRLITASRGRALVLFTSVKHMREAAVALRVMNTDLDIRVQYEAPVPDLVAWLKDHDERRPGKVLLATKSFFTGIDVQGEALTLVIVTKMPFPPPDEPLYQARCERVEAAGGSAFSDLTIPMASLELQQAVGRLIRHRNDKGVCAILDPRLLKGYGRRIVADLPPMGQVHQISDIEQFLESA